MRAMHHSKEFSKEYATASMSYSDLYDVLKNILAHLRSIVAWTGGLTKDAVDETKKVRASQTVLSATDIPTSLKRLNRAYENLYATVSWTIRELMYAVARPESRAGHALEGCRYFLHERRSNGDVNRSLCPV